MKKILIRLIRIYQNIPGEFHNYCRHYPTCSEYAIIAIDRFGAFKGCYLAIKRIIKCNPLGTYGYDPVPMKEGKE